MIKSSMVKSAWLGSLLGWGLGLSGTALVGLPILAAWLTGKWYRKFREIGTPDPESESLKELIQEYEAKLHEGEIRRRMQKSLSRGVAPASRFRGMI